MANYQPPNSRSNRFEKKRKGTKLMNWLAAAGSLLVIVLISLFAFGGDDQQSTAKESGDSNTEQKEDTKEDKSNEDSAENKDKEDDPTEGLVVEERSDESEDEKSKDENNKEQSNEDKQSEATVKESDKENVKSVITKEWEPVQTQQELDGSHRVVYDESSQDWQEMLIAVRQATGLTKDNMVTDYIQNGGSPNKAIATVYNSEKESEIYRVYLQWIEQVGYQVQKVEVLESLPESYE